jgi:hypothetical protein
MKPHSRIPLRKGPTPQPPGLRLLRRSLLVVAGFVLIGGAAWAALELIVWNRLPSELVGKWVVVEGQMEGATFQFYRDGSMVATAMLGRQQRTLKGRVEIGKQNTLKILYVTARDNETGEDYTVAKVIRVLNARQLVLEDEQGKLLRLERMKE